MCTGSEELRKLSGWEGRGPVSRQKLMNKLQSNLEDKLLKVVQPSLTQTLSLLSLFTSQHNATAEKTTNAFGSVDQLPS